MEVAMSVELVFKASRTLEKLRSGPLRSHLDGFCDWLLKQGFKRGTIRQHLGNVSHFNEFLAKQNLSELWTLSAKEVRVHPHNGSMRRY